MSDIFDALQKAQREVESQRSPATTVPVTAPSSNGGNGNRPESTAVAAQPAPAVTTRRRRRGGWRSWVWPAPHRNGHAHRGPLIAKPDSAVGEQFRVLRTRVETVGPGKFMVTSALDHEGKTACAANLATALSMSVGPEIVLVDADLRNSSLGTYFDIHHKPGLADVLLGEADWRDCLAPTRYRGLQVLPAGRRTPMACELLGSERMRQFVTELKTEFPRQYLLFDTPPVLLTADPEVVARHMDHVVIVVRAGVAPRAAVLKAIEALHSEHILGLVFNEATESVSSYYYYGRGYGYPKRGGDGA